MAKKDKYRKTEAADFFDYSGNGISGEERNAFEKHLQKDAFEAEAAEGLSKVSRNEAMEDLSAVSRKIKLRINRNKRIAWYSAAAAIASILIVSTVFFNIVDIKPNRNEALEKIAMEAEQSYAVEREEKDTQAAASELAAEQADKQTDELISDAETSKKSDIKASQTVSVTTELKKEIIDELDVDAELNATTVATTNIQENKNTQKQSASRQEVSSSKKSDRNMPIVLNNAAETKQAEELLAGKVAGVIVSTEDNMPIPGARVVLGGSSIGAVTDVNGKFVLNTDDSEDKTLVASFIGMESQEVSVKTGEHIEIKMDPSVTSLDEVVVVGYASTKKSMTLGAVQPVQIDDEEDEYNYSEAYPASGILPFKRYIDSALVYPVTTYQHNKAVVVLKFKVRQNGRPYDINVVKTPGDEFTKEAIRVVKSGPEWVPASKNDMYTEGDVRLRIVFKYK